MKSAPFFLNRMKSALGRALFSFLFVKLMVPETLRAH
jgi:hypothetical protein